MFDRLRGRLAHVAPLRSRRSGRAPLRKRW